MTRRITERTATASSDGRNLKGIESATRDGAKRFFYRCSVLIFSEEKDKAMSDKEDIMTSVNLPECAVMLILRLSAVKYANLDHANSCDINIRRYI